jgi:hypothetical protein
MNASGLSKGNSILCLILLILSMYACKQDKDEPQEPVYTTNILEFDYSGYLSGHYLVRESLLANDTLPDIGSINAIIWSEFGEDWITFNTYMPTDQVNTYNLLQIEFREGLGTFQLPSARQMDFLSFNYSIAGADQHNFQFTSGKVIVTNNKNDRVIGTFDGVIVDSQGNQITITNGTFNLHVIPN